jgi:hypothetical protein
VADTIAPKEDTRTPAMIEAYKKEKKAKKEGNVGLYWMTDLDLSNNYNARRAESEIMLDEKVKRHQQGKDIDIRTNIKGLMDGMQIALEILQGLGTNESHTRRLHTTHKAISEARTGVESPFQPSKRSRSTLEQYANQNRRRSSSESSSATNSPRTATSSDDAGAEN